MHMEVCLWQTHVHERCLLYSLQMQGHLGCIPIRFTVVFFVQSKYSQICWCFNGRNLTCGHLTALLISWSRNFWKGGGGQGCNFVKIYRGHVGPWTKKFRSPQENLWAHNEIRFIEENYERKSAKHDVNVIGFCCQSYNHAHTVKPVYNGRSMEKQKVAVAGRWPLYRGVQVHQAISFIFFHTKCFLFGRHFQKDKSTLCYCWFKITHNYLINGLVIKRNNYLLFIPHPD